MLIYLSKMGIVQSYVSLPEDKREPVKNETLKGPPDSSSYFGVFTIG